MKKTIQIALIICVIAVWGIVIYRLVGNSESSVTQVVNQKNILPTQVNVQNYRDSLLALDYQDPFLRQIKIQPSPRTITPSRLPKKSKQAQKSEVKIQPEKWIDIVYKGLITNNKNGEQIGLVSMHGSDLIVRKNDLIADTKIIYLSRDSIGLQSKSGKRKMVGR